MLHFILDAVERCYFIFAIDPKRIAKAFKEESAHGDETKGYLDKVLDLQLSLPPASKDEVLEMLHKRIDQKACPKLYATLSNLRDHLPTNPRMADRFLRDADGRERMFLSRFEKNEQNYEGFFLLLILEILYPQAHQNLRDNLADFDGITFLARRGMFGNDSAEDQKHKDFLEKVVEGLAPEEVMPAKKLLDRLTYLSANLLIFDEGQPALDFSWAFVGYRKLIRFSAADRLAFLEIWRKSAGKESIDPMIQKVNDYGDKDLVARETLNLEIEIIGNGFNLAYRLQRDGADLNPLKIELEQRIGCLIAHAIAIFEGNMQDLDRLIFNQEMFGAWLETAQSKLILGLPNEFISAMLPLRRKLTISLANLLPPKIRYRWAWHEVLQIPHLADGNAKNALEEEFIPVREEILNDLTNQFAHSLRTTPLNNSSLPPWMTDAGIFNLIDPTKWIPNSKVDDQPTLDALVGEAPYNALLRENFAVLITEAILAIYENDPEDATLSHSKARPCIEENPWLLPKCWNGAWSGPLSEKSSAKLRALRTKAIEVEKSLVERRNLQPTILDILNGLAVPHDTPTSQVDCT